ncbi:MAG: multicopper oxidase family protein [Oceanospirillaceae bacterium]|nr:multicopper oxidase family protein [Oceanospirillaceae bacterium]
MLNRRHFLSLSSLLLLPVSRVVEALVPNHQLLNITLKSEKKKWFSNYSPIILWGSDVEKIILKQHENVQIEVKNELSDATSLHWHGMRVKNNMDGVSGLTQAPIAIGSSFTYNITAQDAGTFWAHSHHNTYQQLAMGLYFPLIVKEEEEYKVDQDLLLVIDDWRINEHRQLDLESLGDFSEWAHGGRKGNIITVNREIEQSYLCKVGQRIRLRLLNAANSRIMTLQLPVLPTWILAKDGQPLTVPIKLDKAITIGPAERYDLIIDVTSSAGNYPIYEVSTTQNIQVATLNVISGKDIVPSSSSPSALPENPLAKLDFDQISHSTKLLMEGGAMGSLRQAKYQGEVLSVNELVKNKKIWSFNGTAGIDDKPLLSAKSGEMIEIEIINNTRWPHVMHMHGHHFKADSEHYPKGIWHDTLLLLAKEEATIVFRAGDVGKWLLHCHMIEHQASGMVTWIEVT